MQTPSFWHCYVLATLLALPFVAPAAPTVDYRGGQFLPFTRFSAFEKSAGSRPRETVLTSPVILSRIQWDELVLSWNADMPDSAYLKLEARAFYPTGPTKYFTLGLWSIDPSRSPRESVPGQKDQHGDVSTDTLILARPSDRLQLRLTLGSHDRLRPQLKFLGVSLTDTSHKPRPLPQNQLAWGLQLPVPEISQMAYTNGGVLCSPATLAMMLGYWSQKLDQPGIAHDVPEISAAIYDAKWPGTGNWSFNMAYAGSLPGLRAYVTRLSDLAELEDWIARGVPVGLSLCYDRLRGKQSGPSGHLVVCVGFTAEGDPIINDPGTSKNIRKIFPRKNLIHAWAYSRNAAYLVYPETFEIPKDRFAHWASWSSRQCLRFE